MIPTKIYGCPVHMFECLIDVLIRRIAPAAGSAIIFFASRIGAGASQQFHDSAETAPPIEARIHARVIVQVFSVDHSGTIHFGDGRLHFAIGLKQLARHIRFFPNPQQELSRAQIASGAQVGGMASRCVGIDGRGKYGDNYTNQT